MMSQAGVPNAARDNPIVTAGQQPKILKNVQNKKPFIYIIFFFNQKPIVSFFLLLFFIPNGIFFAVCPIQFSASLEKKNPT